MVPDVQGWFILVWEYLRHISAFVVALLMFSTLGSAIFVLFLMLKKKPAQEDDGSDGI